MINNASKDNNSFNPKILAEVTQNYRKESLYLSTSVSKTVKGQRYEDYLSYEKVENPIKERFKQL